MAAKKTINKSNKIEFMLPRLMSAHDYYRIVSNDIIDICMPLSPTKNAWTRSNWRTINRYRDKIYEHTKIIMSLAMRFSPRNCRTWSNHITVDITRCSLSNRVSDTQNIIVGMEKHFDALVYAEIIPDDSPSHLSLGEIVEYTKTRWELPGPATWIRLSRRLVC